MVRPNHLVRTRTHKSRNAHGLCDVRIMLRSVHLDWSGSTSALCRNATSNVEVVQKKEPPEGGFSNLETRGSDEAKCWLSHPNSRDRMHAARYVDCKEPDQLFAVDLNDNKKPMSQ